MTFRNTGKRDPVNTISRDATYLDANDGLLIPAYAADKSIVVYDVLSYGLGKLGTAANGGGTQLGFINAGQNHFGISIIVPAGQGVYTNAQSGNMTITYAVVDGLTVGSIRNTVTEGGGATTTTTTGPTTTTTTAAPTNLRFALGTSSVAEGNAGTSTHTVTVERIGNASGTATVYYETANLTAISGVDYTVASGTLTFAAGVTSQTISITIAGETVNEDDETFNITLSSPTQTVGVASITGTNPHVVTITNDDTLMIGFSASASSVTEANTTYLIPVSRGGDTNGTASVDYVTANGGTGATRAYSGTDYTATSGTLTFADGVDSANISVVILDDANNEDGEEFTVTLSNATSQYGTAALGTSVHTVTILNDDSVRFSWDNITSEVTVEGDTGTQIHTVTVIRDDGWGTASVDYETVDDTATAGTDYTGISTTTLNFASGSQSETIDVVITGDTTVELDETFKILLTNPQSEHGAATIFSTNPHIVTILNDDTTTTTTTTAAPASNFCMAEVAGSASYWNLNTVFEPVVGANATHNGKTQYTNIATVGDSYCSGMSNCNFYITYDSTNSAWQLNDDVNLTGSPYGNSDGDADDPWDAGWTNAYVMTETSASHCAPAGTPSFCIDASGYAEDGTWVPYATYGGKPVWALLDTTSAGDSLFMWYSASGSGVGMEGAWNFTDYGWGLHEDSYSGSIGNNVWGYSDADCTDPWDCTWSNISGCTTYTVDTSTTVNFTKADWANSSLEANQDRITNGVWITRGDSQGLYNAFNESGWDNSSYDTPTDTEWAVGTVAGGYGTNETDYDDGNFDTWVEVMGDPSMGGGWDPSNAVGHDFVLRIGGSGGILLDIKFTSWTSGDGSGGAGGGGFAYTRSVVNSSSCVTEGSC